VLGQNSTGQIGDGSRQSASDAVDVVGLMSGVTALEAGAPACTLTLAAASSAGAGTATAVGDNSNTERDTPVDVNGLTSGVSGIAVGQYHSCALVGAGVKCWGWNDYGQVGDNTSGTPRLIPVNVLGLASGVSGIAAGNGHTCAALTGGGVKCWGDNTYGQVGDGTSANTRLAPVDVAGVSGASAVATGGLHTCARVGGGLACWGLNSNGQLGDNTVNQRVTATKRTGLTALEAVMAVAFMRDHGRRRRSLLGQERAGQLGDGTLSAS
jgi:alpha-tubulin suppressor-like RCC1 family protein